MGKQFNGIKHRRIMHTSDITYRSGLCRSRSSDLEFASEVLKLRDSLVGRKGFEFLTLECVQPQCLLVNEIAKYLFAIEHGHLLPH
jgi:hypothetical protein